MKKLINFCLCSLLCMHSSAQIKEFFRDDFSSNKNKWEEAAIENLYGKVENGKYTIDNKLESAASPCVIIGLNDKKDFKISASINTISLKNQDGYYGIIFGSNRYDFFSFIASVSGYYTLVHSDGVKFDNIIPFTQTDNLKKGLQANNQLEIRRLSGNWDLVINGISVNTIPARDFYGPFIGFYNEGIKVEYDDLKVSGNKITTSGNICSLFPLIFQSSKTNFDYIKGTKTWYGNTDFNLSISLEEDKDAFISLHESSWNSFFANLKRNITKAGAIKSTDSIINIMKKNLPDYVFTKTITYDSLTRYDIREKNNPAGGFPVATIGIYYISAYDTDFHITSESAKRKEQLAVVTANPVNKDIPEKIVPTSGWIINDKFADNKNQWPVDSTDKEHYFIRGDHYVLKQTTDNPLFIGRSFTLDDTHDYKVESVIENYTGSWKNHFGLAIGVEGKKGLFFLASNEGYIDIYEESDAGTKYIQKSSFETAFKIGYVSISLGVSNKFSLIKKNDLWSFRINDIEIYSCAARPLQGKKFGFYLPVNASLFIYSFKIYDKTLAEKFPDQPKEYF